MTDEQHQQWCKDLEELHKLRAENEELKEIILTAPGVDEDDFLSKYQSWWDMHYRELRSPGCNLPHSTFRQLQAENKKLKETIEAALRISDFLIAVSIVRGL